MIKKGKSFGFERDFKNEDEIQFNKIGKVMAGKQSLFFFRSYVYFSLDVRNRSWSH